jgi:hypothetical protein
MIVAPLANGQSAQTHDNPAGREIGAALINKLRNFFAFNERSQRKTWRFSAAILRYNAYSK